MLYGRAPRNAKFSRFLPAVCSTVILIQQSGPDSLWLNIILFKKLVAGQRPGYGIKIW